MSERARAFASLRRRRGSSTSAGRARRSTTGRWPAGWAARSCCASRTPTAARHDEESTHGIIDALAWLGIGATSPTFEGPYFQSDFAAAHVAAATRSVRRGHAYYCDLTGEQIQQRSTASGTPGYDGYSRDRGLGPGPGRVLRFRTPDDGVTIVDDVIRGDVTLRQRARSRTSSCCAATARRCSCSPTSSTTSRWASPTWCAVTSTCPTRPSSSCSGRRSARRRRSGPTCRCSSTSHARSCRSAATRWRSSSSATRATSPTRWSTT